VATPPRGATVAGDRLTRRAATVRRRGRRDRRGATYIVKADPAFASVLVAPNVVPAHPRILTAGLGAGAPIQGFGAVRTQLATSDAAVILLRDRQVDPKVPVALDASGRPDLDALPGRLAGAGGGQPAAAGALRWP
jgi:hypothetical protein